MGYPRYRNHGYIVRYAMPSTTTRAWGILRVTHHTSGNPFIAQISIPYYHSYHSTLSPSTLTPKPSTQNRQVYIKPVPQTLNPTP